MTMYSATLTTAGEALYAAALANNTPIQLGQMAIGDGGGSPVVTPDPTCTTLVNQVYIGPVSSLWVDSNDPTLMWAQLLVGPTIGGFTIREVGLRTQSGVLFAIANFPDTIKPIIANGSAVDLAINFGLKVSNTALVALSVNPNIVGATQAWVVSTITPAYLLPGGTQYQVLQKNSSANGDVNWVDSGAPWEILLATTGGTTVLAPTQALVQIVNVTGALTANATLVFPASPRRWTIANNTTGNYSLTAIALNGTGVAVLQGNADTVYCDGTNVHYASSSSLTRPANDGSTATATTAYVDRAITDIGGYSTDTGVANAYVITLNPPIAAYANGTTFKFRAAHANTAGCTLNAGPGSIPLLRDDGSAMQPGDIGANVIVMCTYDSVAGAALVESIVVSQLGALAKLNIGAHLANDGSGNLTVPLGMGLNADGSGNLQVKTADNTLRLTASGLQVNEPVTYVSGATSLTATSHGGNFVSTASCTLTVPLTTTLWNGFVFAVSANVGTVTVQPNAADKINSGTVGVAYVVQNKTSAAFFCDGAGNISVLFQTPIPNFSFAPQYINSAQTLLPGQYLTDTRLGSFAVTLPAAPTKGMAVRLVDIFFSWGVNNLIVIPNGSTIMGNTDNLFCNVTGEDVMLCYNGTDWRLF